MFLFLALLSEGHGRWSSQPKRSAHRFSRAGYSAAELQRASSERRRAAGSPSAGPIILRKFRALLSSFGAICYLAPIVVAAVLPAEGACSSAGKAPLSPPRPLRFVVSFFFSFFFIFCCIVPSLHLASSLFFYVFASSSIHGPPARACAQCVCDGPLDAATATHASSSRGSQTKPPRHLLFFLSAVFLFFAGLLTPREPPLLLLMLPARHRP